MAKPIQVSENSFQFGIDARSPENNIRDGFVRDLVNMDTTEGKVSKRKGYEGFGGGIPLRVQSYVLDDVNNRIYLTFDSSVDLSAVSSTPLLIYGTYDDSNAMFSETFRYYESFSSEIKKRFAPSSTSIIPIGAAEHGLVSEDMFVGLTESISSDISNAHLLWDSIEIDEASRDVEISYTNSTTQPVETYVYYKDGAPKPGRVYKWEFTHTGSPESQTFQVTKATHGLDGVLVYQLFTTSGLVRTRDIPNSFVINGSTVEVSIENTTGGSLNFVVLLAEADGVSFATANLVDTLETLTIASIEDPFLFTNVYTYSVAGLEEIIPHEIKYDAPSKELQVTAYNPTGLARSYYVAYAVGFTKTNTIYVEDLDIVSAPTTSQLTVWGIPHAEAYGNNKRNYRRGWVTHIDSYRRQGESRVVAGLGGNIFAAYSPTDLGFSDSQLKLSAISKELQYLGPTFYQTGDTPERSRGYITTSGLRVSGVEMVSGNLKFVVKAQSYQAFTSNHVATSVSSVISTDSVLGDWLTVRGTSSKKTDGNFKIVSINEVDANTLEFFVSAPGVPSNYKDLGSGGIPEITTDQIKLDSVNTTNLMVGDVITSKAINLEIVGIQGTTLLVKNVSETVSLEASETIGARRISSILYFKDAISSMVVGDGLQLPGLDRLVHIKRLVPNTRTVTTLVGDGVDATATLSSTTGLGVGDQVIIRGAGVYLTPVITSITATKFTFKHPTVLSETNLDLVGGYVVVDESVSWEENLRETEFVSVPNRWMPLEAPITSRIPVSYFKTRPYEDQNFIRSTIVSNNMYFTNGDDEVLKFDGQNIYRAGLIPWQPGAFISVEPSAGIPILAPEIAVVSWTGDTFTVSSGDALTFSEGERIYHPTTDNFFTIQKIVHSTNKIQVDQTIGGVSAAGLLQKAFIRRYYFKLASVDANGNQVTGPVTGSQDYVVELARSKSKVNIKMLGFPKWGLYDYNRIYVEAYTTPLGTTQGAVPDFFRIASKKFTFNGGQDGYVEVVDTFSDDALLAFSKDPSAVLKPNLLGINWTSPLRAKYVTSANNKLILGNLKGYPEIDLQIIGDSTLGVDNFVGNTVQLRKNNEDTSSGTNNTDRVRFEFVKDSTGVNTSAASTASGEFSFKASITVAAGDWIYLYHKTNTTKPLSFSGWWQVDSFTAGSPNTIKVKCANPGSTTNFPDRVIKATSAKDVPVLLDNDGNLGMVGSSDSNLLIFEVGRRLGLAINASQRMVASSGYVPWVIARSGNDTGSAGRVVISQPKGEITTFEVEYTGNTNYQVFINGGQTASGTQVSARTKVFPSRIISSYDNYAELFDAPDIADPSISSDSATDINESDGQELTGIIPFFGESAFGSSQQSAVVVIFKQNSIHLHDVVARSQGFADNTKKLETEGLGCTAPFSIASSKGGITFANVAGIYILRRNQAIQFLGRYLGRLWGGVIDRRYLEIIQGHHYGEGRKYKLSVPILEESGEAYAENSQVYVYDHTAEEEGNLGAWTRYTNHPATGWTNLFEQAYFGSTSGQVFRIRNSDTKTDYRDGVNSVAAKLVTRPNNFGADGVRKNVLGATVHYRSANEKHTSVSYAEDTRESPRPTSSMKLVPNGHSIVSIYHSLGDRRRCLFMNLVIANDGLDENLEVAGISYHVLGLSPEGTKQAAETSE